MAETTSRRRVAKFSPVLIALSLDDAQIKGALVNETGRLLNERQVSVKHTTVRATVAAISQLILELAALSERGRHQVSAIGVNVPGIIDYQAERVSFKQHGHYTWERVPLRSMIENTLESSGVDIRLPETAAPHREAKMTSAHPHLIVCATRDAQVAAEAWCGAASGKSHVVTLSLGNPLITGLLLNGTVVHGVGDLAGAAAWLGLNETYKNEYGQQGAFAFEADETALVRRTLEKWTPDVDSVLSQVAFSNPAQITVPTILRAARSKDPLALSVVLETCEWIGRAAANLISLLNPEALVIGGKFGQMLKPFLSDIKRETKKWAHPGAFKQCQIMMTTLGPDAELLGAAKLAMEAAQRESR